MAKSSLSSLQTGGTRDYATTQAKIDDTKAEKQGETKAASDFNFSRDSLSDANHALQYRGAQANAEGENWDDFTNTDFNNYKIDVINAALKNSLGDVIRYDEDEYNAAFKSAANSLLGTDQANLLMDTDEYKQALKIYEDANTGRESLATGDDVNFLTNIGNGLENFLTTIGTGIDDTFDAMIGDALGISDLIDGENIGSFLSTAMDFIPYVGAIKMGIQGAGNLIDLANNVDSATGKTYDELYTDENGEVDQSAITGAKVSSALGDVLSFLPGVKGTAKLLESKAIKDSAAGAINALKASKLETEAAEKAGKEIIAKAEKDLAGAKNTEGVAENVKEQLQKNLDTAKQTAENRINAANETAQKLKDSRMTLENVQNAISEGNLTRNARKQLTKLLDNSGLVTRETTKTANPILESLSNKKDVFSKTAKRILSEKEAKEQAAEKAGEILANAGKVAESKGVRDTLAEALTSKFTGNAIGALGGAALGAGQTMATSGGNLEDLNFTDLIGSAILGSFLGGGKGRNAYQKIAKLAPTYNATSVRASSPNTLYLDPYSKTGENIQDVLNELEVGDDYSLLASDIDFDADMKSILEQAEKAQKYTDISNKLGNKEGNDAQSQTDIGEYYAKVLNSDNYDAKNYEDAENYRMKFMVDYLTALGFDPEKIYTNNAKARASKPSTSHKPNESSSKSS